jgi:hypothetical protein
VIQLRQREEGVMAQFSHNPAFNKLNTCLGLGFILSHQLSVIWTLLHPKPKRLRSPIPFTRCGECVSF